ncbi:MAG: MFS transporter [Gammaproteobacteria bacterium]|nr:MFS transporter [Gammaproteobacteria bacterium]
MPRISRLAGLGALVAIGCASSAAHIGNNFTTYLIGGLVDRYGFSPVAMGAFAMAETLAYAGALFLAAPRVSRLSARSIAIAASCLVVAAQGGSAFIAFYALLLALRLAAGFGFGLMNCAVNLAAGRTGQPTRAISAGIALQTLLFAAVNIGLPAIGASAGIGGMFLGLALLSAALGLGALLLPAGRGAAPAAAATTDARTAPIDAQGFMTLTAMALFTFGSMAIWPFMERTAHAIGMSAVEFGHYQSFATLMSAVGSFALMFLAPRLRRSVALAAALLVCGAASALLTTTSHAPMLGLALVLYNVSWFITYALLVGLAFAVDPTGRLAVTASGTWLLFQSAGSLAAGMIAQAFGGYGPIGPLGLIACVVAIAIMWPVARRAERAGRTLAAAAAAAH